LRLDALAVTNFRSFVESEFQFNPQLNLIIGANGSGKSSLIAAIRAALSDAVKALSRDFAGESIEDADVRFETEQVGQRVRFEKKFPTTIRAKAQLFGSPVTWKIERSTEATAPGIAGEIYSPTQQKMVSIDTSAPFTLPLIAFYGPQRSVRTGGGSLQSAASAKISRSHGYQGWRNSIVDRSQLENWVIGKTLERLQHVFEGESSAQAEMDELSLVNTAIKGCIEGATGLRYDLRLRSLMVEFEDRPPKPFPSLSDGQQGMISVVADVARRMCILNPHLDRRVLLETDGILAIDELDIHLHPSLQRHVPTVLRTAFPRIQIFATAHSPQIIGGLPANEVMILKEGKWEQPQVTYGLDASQVLEEVMGVDSREPRVSDTIEALFSSIEKGDIEGAKEKLAKFRKEAPGLPDYAHLESLIRRKELLGR
jgi:predicted ATP-binding protein involved in virulence